MSHFIKSLSDTNQQASRYINGAKFNIEVATQLFVFSTHPDWHEILVKDPLALFYSWDKLGKSLGIESRQERSKLLEHSLWMDYIEGDGYHACLCTDQAGMVKTGYWTSLQYLGEYMKDDDIKGCIKTEAEAIDILKNHRRILLNQYFKSKDVDFIMNTIPCTTVLK